MLPRLLHREKENKENHSWSVRGSLPHKWLIMKWLKIAQPKKFLKGLGLDFLVGPKQVVVTVTG